MAFKNDNVAQKLPAGGQYQVGSSNIDPDAVGKVEQGFLLPFPADPEFSWVYYDCTVEVILDSGIVVHNRLPQFDGPPDTLASCQLDASDLVKLKGGVNIKSNDRYADIVQRMAHSRYWFRLYGQALRIGLQVPIPSIKTIGGVPVIPHDDNPQRAFNRIKGNYGGIILWHAAWSLWYTTLVPPRSNVFPAADPSSRINVDSPAPVNGIQAPYTQPDDNAVKSAAPSVQFQQSTGGGNNAQIVR